MSHETIYKSLFIQVRDVLKKELIQCLRTRRAMRRSRHSSLKGKGLWKIVDAVPISERPPSVEDRAVPGHWEGDLIAGSRNSYIATLVERRTRYVMLAKVKKKNTAVVIEALIKQSRKLPSELYKSLTWDRGSELSDHKKFTLATDIQVVLYALTTYSLAAYVPRSCMARCASSIADSVMALDAASIPANAILPTRCRASTHGRRSCRHHSGHQATSSDSASTEYA